MASPELKVGGDRSSQARRPWAALHREAGPRRPSVRNGSPYLVRHGGTELRDSLAHLASGAVPAEGCTETQETLRNSGPVLHGRRRGRGPGCTESRRVGSPESAPRFASREGWSRFRPQPPASQPQQRRRRLHFPECSVTGAWFRRRGGVGVLFTAPPLQLLRFRDWLGVH